MPDGIFSSLIGHDGAKKILRSALRSGEVDVLLTGPPGSGKSVALLCIEENVPKAEYVDASGYTDSQMRDDLAQNPPLMALDEFDDMKEYDALQTAMEQDRVQKNNQHTKYDRACTTQFVAAANYTRKIDESILDRFIPIEFEEYTLPEYLDVCEQLLQDVVDWVESAEEAVKAAYMVWDVTGSKDVRKARDAAKLASDVRDVVDVARAMEDPKVEVDSDPLTEDELVELMDERASTEDGYGTSGGFTTIEEVRKTWRDQRT